MKVIRFAEDFPKLQDDIFSTIRATPKNIRTGQAYMIKSPSNEFKAILVRKLTEKLSEMDTEELLHDTNTTSREEAMAALREYYPDLQEDNLMQVLWFIPDGRE